MKCDVKNPEQTTKNSQNSAQKLLQINENFEITYSFDIAQSSYTQLRNLKKINDDHDFGDDGEDANNEDAVLRRMLEGGVVKKDNYVKRQMKLLLKRVCHENNNNNNGSELGCVVECDAFEKEAWNIKTEKLVVGTVLAVKGKIHFVNNVLMLTRDSVRVVQVASQVDTGERVIGFGFEVFWTVAPVPVLGQFGTFSGKKIEILKSCLPARIK